MTMAPETDVLVVGGGAVGLAAALLAHRSGLSVRVLERQPLPPGPVADAPAESRVYALAPASTELLASLAAWPTSYAGFAPGLIRAMDVYEHASGGRIAFGGEGGVLAQVIGHEALVGALADAARAANIVVNVIGPIEAVTSDAAGATVRTDSGESFRGRLLLAADGGRSVLREKLTIGERGEPYPQLGLTAVLDLSAPHDGVARQHFHDGDIVALLPLADPQRAVLVWSASEARARELAEVDDEAFCRAADAALAADPLHVTAVSSRARFPLAWQLAESVHKDRVLLIGDAAHVMHPLAGQGLNLGLADVAALADDVIPALAAKRPGLAASLARYARWRRSEALLYKVTTDGLYRLFAFAPARFARGLGLNLVDRASPLKRLLASRAMGAVDPAPDGFTPSAP